MIALLYLGHGFLGLVALLSVGSSPRARTRLVPFVGGVGIALGLALFLLRHSGEVWRTTRVEPGTAVAAGLAAACAWLLVVVLDRGEGRWEPPALTGAAACGLTLFAINGWTVPALLFWWASTAAIGVAARNTPGRAQLWTTLAVSDALFTAALIWHATAAEAWQLPPTIGGAPYWLLVGAALLRAGILPRVAGWGIGISYIWPLLPGGAFALVAGVLGREQPWVAVALLLGSLGMVVWLLIREELELSLAASWPVALMLAVLFVVPGAPWQAAAAGLIVGTSVLLWPVAEGRAQVERGLMVAFVPPSAGFSAIVAAALASFHQATATTDLLAAAPWTAVTALLPAAVAGGVILGTRIGRRAEAEHFQSSGVVATWGLFGALVVAGLWPRLAGASAVSGKVAWLNLVALGAGLVAARFAILPAELTPAEPAERTRISVLTVDARLALALTWAAAVTGAAAAVAMLWFTYRGLQVGFL